MRTTAMAGLLGLASCALEPDVVARLPDENRVAPSSKDAGRLQDELADAGILRKDAGPGVGPPCSSKASSLLLLDAKGAASHLPPLAAAAPSELPECLAGGVLAATVDRTGMLWASTPEGRIWWIDPSSGACKPTELEASVDTLAFVYDPASDRELLYMRDRGSLVQLDPVTLERTTLSMFDSVAILIGSDRGKLFALYEVTGDLLLLENVSLADGSTTSELEIPVVPNATFVGATGWRGGVALLFDSGVYHVPLGENPLTLEAAFPASGVGFTRIAASTCSSTK
jgi:hypothetical protein